MRLALTYLLLALIATLVNIGLQDITLQLYAGAFQVAASVLVGTAGGLLVKYALDKRYIFRFRADNLGHDSRVFALYTAAGLVTTAIFWGFEFGFDHLFGSKQARYAGAILGLGIGYLCKYQLDKRFVFARSAS
ncbi:GtrA family protein [Massilia endophytica]|uniref:GtrA family protein n=1 Tax=Massilia endophytica TaxID=2899220 RepID=UPI001E500556|nr:GtrA family protein [Massilia endophytica]UGQ45494.1 GtrA family protein [Massilia endophytica]